MIFKIQRAVIGSYLVCLGKSNLFGWHSSFVLQVSYISFKLLINCCTVTKMQSWQMYSSAVNALERSFFLLTALTIRPSAFHPFTGILLFIATNISFQHSSHELRTQFLFTYVIVIWTPFSSLWWWTGITYFLGFQFCAFSPFALHFWKNLFVNIHQLADYISSNAS